MNLVLRQITAAIDPDGARPREERAIRRRSFRITQQDEDGLFPVSGRILPEIGMLLLGMIEAARRSPRFVEVTGLGDPPDVGQLLSASATGGADSRTPAQLRHDALAAILMAASVAKDSPRLDGDPVTVVVIARSDELNRGGRPGDPIGTMAGSRFPLSRTEVEAFIDSSGVRIVTENGAGAILGISSTQRCFTNAQRLAIAARDGFRCATPGCSNSPFALQAHHVITDRDRGPTTTDNGILLCYWHHKQVDTGPWKYRIVEGLPEVRGPGIWEWTRLRPNYAKAAYS